MKFQYITLLLISLFLVRCSEKNNSDSDNTDVIKASVSKKATRYQISREQFKMEGLSLIKMGKSKFPNLIKTTGILEVPPNNKAIVSAHIGGYVKNSHHLVGDEVKKGELLVSIENIEFLQLQQEFLEAAEQQVFLKSEYERKKELYEEKIASKKAYLKAESDYRKNLALVKTLKAKLKMLNIDPEAVLLGELTSLSNIYAPISGDITEIDVNTGKYLDPADHIMEIINTEHIHLELKIFEKDALQIQKGQLVHFRLPESTSQKFKGSIYLIGRSIGADRSIRVHVHIDEEEAYRFIPGMFAQADIEIDSGEFASLPEEAVVEEDGENYALMISAADETGYTFEKKLLETGRVHKGQVQILNPEAISVKDSDFISGGFNLLREDSDSGQ